MAAAHHSVCAQPANTLGRFAGDGTMLQNEVSVKDPARDPGSVRRLRYSPTPRPFE